MTPRSPPAGCGLQTDHNGAQQETIVPLRGKVTITASSAAAGEGDMEQLASAPPSHGSFGALLRARRHRALLSQEQLAARAEVSERTVRELEAGRVRSPRPGTVRLLADALRLTGPQREGWFAAARGVNHPRAGPTAP